MSMHRKDGIEFPKALNVGRKCLQMLDIPTEKLDHR